MACVSVQNKDATFVDLSGNKIADFDDPLIFNGMTALTILYLNLNQLMVHATNQPIVRQGLIAPTAAPAATTVLGGIGTHSTALNARVLDGATPPPPLISTVTLGR